jgi:hypothetical protein
MVHPLSNAALHPLMATRLLSLRLLIVYPLSNGVLHPLMAPRLLPQVNNLLFLKQLLHRQLPAGMFPLLRSKLLREPIGILGVVLRLAQLGNYADLFTCTLITGLSREESSQVSLSLGFYGSDSLVAPRTRTLLQFFF